MGRKKAFLVVPRNAGAAEAGLKTGKGIVKFNGKTCINVTDEALAREIDTQHGLKGTGDVWVAEDDRTESFLRDDGGLGVGVHRYFWGASPRFSNAWDAFERRRKDKSQRSAENAGEEPEVDGDSNSQ